MGANQSSKGPLEAPHQFDATNNIGSHNNNNNNKLSFRKQHMKLFNRKAKSQLLDTKNNNPDDGWLKSRNDIGKLSNTSSNESQQQQLPVSATAIDETWNATFDATNESKPGYYVSNGGRKPMLSNNYPSMQQANNNGQQYQYHQIDKNGSSQHHSISDRLVGATDTLGRRNQQQLAANEFHSTPQKSSEVRDSSNLLNNNGNVRDQHQRERQHHQQQLNSNGNSITTAIVNNNDRNNYSQTCRSFQQQPLGSSSPQGDSFIASTTSSATKQLLNNGVPYHLSRAVNSRTSNVLNNSSQQQQQKNNNYNYNHNSHNDDDNNNAAVAMTNASNASPLANKHHNHQRASSESWSKHHHQQMVLAALQQQQQHRNNVGQTNRQLYQQEAHSNHINRSKSGHQSVNASLASYAPVADTENTYYDEIIHQPSGIDNQVFDDDLEQYYSRNLHLLDQQQQRKHQATSTEFADNQIYYNNNNNNINQLPTATDFANGHMSAPLQRRYKWPKQQYQYLNQAAAAESQTPLTYRTQLNNSHQVPFVASTPFDNYNRTYSFESAGRRKNSTGRSRNPLAALFYPTSGVQNTSSVSSSAQFKKYSNTIHLSSSKSHQTLNLSSNQRASCPGGGSLKRIKSSPLTAQQASYEAMRTIDMYLIRQIARSCMVSSVILLSSLTFI